MDAWTTWTDTEGAAVTDFRSVITPDEQPEFRAWPKIPRAFRDMVITEKIDGTNACVVVTPNRVFAQSRKRFITPDADNFGFASWVWEHAEELRELGEGYHFGEWWGEGVQRGYGLDHKRFSLFNVGQWWGDPAQDHKLMNGPACCHVVPKLKTWTFDTNVVKGALDELSLEGSKAAPGYMNPEGVIVFQTAGRTLYKALLENDDAPKGQTAESSAAWAARHGGGAYRADEA